MKQTKQLMTELCRRLQLPGDILAGQPKLEAIGQEMISVEPHLGLMEYGTEAVLVRTSLGAVQLLGENLHISLMNSHRITIEGVIETISWKRPEHE